MSDIDVDAVAALQKAANLAKLFEGFSATPYQDPRGIWTYLYGTTRDQYGNPVTANTPPGTIALGVDLMMRDMQSAFDDIRYVVRVPLTSNEEAAIIDFIYNVGAGNFNASSLLKLLNEKQFGNAAKQMLLWDHAGGAVLAGLLRRREAEEQLFLQNYF